MLKAYVESGRFEEDLKSFRPRLDVIAWLIIALAVYEFGGAFLRMVGELVG
jgi:hypothetical protein